MTNFRCASDNENRQAPFAVPTLPPSRAGATEVIKGGPAKLPLTFSRAADRDGRVGTKRRLRPPPVSKELLFRFNGFFVLVRQGQGLSFAAMEIRPLASIEFLPRARGRELPRLFAIFPWARPLLIDFESFSFCLCFRLLEKLSICWRSA